MAERTRSGPRAPVASLPWQKPQACWNNSRPRSTAFGSGSAAEAATASTVIPSTLRRKSMNSQYLDFQQDGISTGCQSLLYGLHQKVGYLRTAQIAVLCKVPQKDFHPREVE